MVIVYSPISCALACGDNETCETLRYWPVSQCEAGLVPIDNEDVSPNKVNSFRPRYTKTPLASLPDMVKPVISMEEINIRTCGTVGVIGESAHRKNNLQYLGEPFHSIKSEVDDMRGRWGNNNPLSSWQGKSERLIRTMKRGNACGVKEPYRHHVYRMGRRPA